MEGIGNYKLEVKISQDKLEAGIMLVITDQEQGTNIQINESEVREILRKSKITHGILEQVVHDLCTNPSKFTAGPVTVAVGSPSVAGTDGKIEYTFMKLNQDDKRPKELEDGRVDFYSITSIPNVAKGQLLARRTPATPGQAGKSVTGEPIVPLPGKEAVLKPGKNVVVNAERSMLYAAIDGQVSFTDKDKVNVFPVFEVNGDVDFSIGNIDFVGTVVIRGNVPTGFRVKASGDIRVLGSVEGADLEAGGSIEIKSGIVAQDKGQVVAGNDVRTSFIQNGNVTAGNQVLVSQSIMFSQVRAGKQIICNGPKGIIIGGTLQAGEKIVARVIGNTSATPTVLEVGVKPELRLELAAINKELQTVYENLRKTDQGLGVLGQMLKVTGDLAPDKKAMQIKLANTRLILEKEGKQLEARKKEVETELEGESPAAVDVYYMMYPGIKMVFGKLVRFIKQEFPRTRFLVINGEITTSTLI
ncbi:FapA family protein [Brevibacillus ruminantium]|uniref:FapA family protein n=1 Tax=Brevibacillus ruminantium TaxID=2950604 RepID=A0ABY4WPE7_9BACL|nr:FapA family protein [Brevibacillus ruminantium]USG67952.1 FapA family protein [Brevibacillus ruminantium]